MKKILLIFILIFSFSILSYGQLTKENINGSILAYNDNDAIKNIIIVNNINDNIRYSYALSFYKYDLLKDFYSFSFNITIITNQKINIEVKDSSFDNLKLKYNNPLKFDNEGNPIEYQYYFSKEIFFLPDIIRELKNDKITIYINDKRYIADNPYKNNKKLKERLIELAIDFCSKENPTLSKKEIEDILLIDYAKNNL